MKQFAMRFSESGGAWPLRMRDGGGTSTLGYECQGHPGATGPTGPTGPAGADAPTYAFDETPTENSENLVASGGIYAALPCVESTASVAVGQTASSGGGAVYQPQVDSAWLKARLLEWLYPVGSVYISTENTCAPALLGGTWRRIKDTFLLAAGDSYESGATGGEAEHKLTTAEMPMHVHNLIVGSGSSAFATGNMGQLIENPNNTHAANGYTNMRIAGGSEAHNNMPPYLVVNMWERVEDLPLEG